MLITHLELENFKSYAQAQISLRPGTNAIIGPNGAGKSTLLEAIGFTLFDHQEEGMSLVSLLHEGTASGRVVVRLISSFDDRAYDVERCFTSKATTRYCIYDVDLALRLVEGTKDVRDWLCQHLRVESPAMLSALFRNTVGVPQGTFTAPFLESPTVRKGIFDPLLRVEEYRKASDSLQPTLRQLEKQASSTREQAARIEGQLERLEELRQEQDALAQEIAGLENRLAILQDELQRAFALLQELERAGKLVGDLALSVERAQAQVAHQKGLLDSAHRQLEEAEQARERVRSAQEGYDAYLDAERQRAALDLRRDARDRLRQERSALQTDRARRATRLEQLAGDLADIATSARRMEELAPLVEQQRELEVALSRAEAALRDLAAAHREEQQAANEVAQARAALERLQAQAQQAGPLERALAQTQARFDQLSECEREARDRKSAVASEVERLSKQAEALGAAGAGGGTAACCPVCESELTPERRDELLAHNAQLTQELHTELRTLDGHLTSYARELKALNADLARDRKHLYVLPTPEVLVQAQDLMALRLNALKQATAEVASLEDTPARLEAFRQALEKLGNPRRQYQLCEDRVRLRPDKEREQQQVLRQERDLADRIAERTLALEAFARLDEDIRAVQALRDQHRSDYEVCMANRAAAQQVESRRGQVEQLTAVLQGQEQSLGELQTQHAQALAAYDARQHERAKQGHNALQLEQAHKQAQVEGRNERLRDIRRQVVHLEGLQGELQRKRDEEQELQELSRMVAMTRDLLKSAGPQITRQLVRRISWEASVFYGDIMGDPSVRLQWAEDYELWLEVKGLKRTFRQLSGGEQMAAALALRLALLRETSAVDIAFFDEPTAHLDPERRDGLAEKIMQVKGFSQLFVISHDDTFEQAAQNYIRIVKDSGGSHPKET